MPTAFAAWWGRHGEPMARAWPADALITARNAYDAGNQDARERAVRLILGDGPLDTCDPLNLLRLRLAAAVGGNDQNPEPA